MIGVSVDDMESKLGAGCGGCLLFLLLIVVHSICFRVRLLDLLLEFEPIPLHQNHLFCTTVAMEMTKQYEHNMMSFLSFKVNTSLNILIVPGSRLRT